MGVLASCRDVVRPTQVHARLATVNVEIWIEDDLQRFPGDRVTPERHLAFSYVDSASATPMEAVRRAWHITNGAIMRLDQEDLVLRQEWSVLAAGMAVSVGDVVRVDGAGWLCTTTGWDRV